jgi:hypothetical protein
MMNTASQLPWEQPQWFVAISAWIHAALARQGIPVTGAIEQPQARPWSTVLRAPTSEGYVYGNACAPLLAHEPALTQALSHWQSAVTPAVLATAAPRAQPAEAVTGWLQEFLHADHG